MKLWLMSWVLVTPALLASDLERAQKFYDRTDYQAALDVLNKTKEPMPAAAWALAGKSSYQLGDLKKAIEAFEKAAQAEPSNSRYANWLGRAWGRRAETANPFAAPGYASKARQYFEKAVTLDPGDQEAVSDLFTYYLEAPGFLGGGIEKAARLTERIKINDSAEYYFALAQIAERRKEYALAEGQLHRAVDLAPRQAGRVVDLAKFLARRGKYAESDRAFTQAARVDPENKRVLYAQAETYIETNRNLDTARNLLKRYIDAPLSPNDPPRAQARRLLKRLGD